MNTAYFNRFSIDLTDEQVDACSHQGDCYYDCEAIQPDVKLDHISPADLRAELEEYGAWGDAELADHHENLIRLVWIAACNIREDKAG